MKSNTSQIIFNEVTLYKTFFCDGKCFVEDTVFMPDLYRLDHVAEKDDRIIIINPIQESKLYEEGYVKDGYEKSKLDNLNHVYVRRYRLKTDDGSKIATSDLFEICDKNCKYSRFLTDLIMEHYYLKHIEFKTMSEMLKINYGLNISANRICDIYQDTVKNFQLKKYEEVADEIRNGKIKLGGSGNYDEEFTHCKHQPVVRLTFIDYKTKIVVKDMVVLRKYFNRNLIKEFIYEATKDYDYHTVVTDGDKRYKRILGELGLNQQRCIFHSMQNLMSRVNPVHRKLRKRIKEINELLEEKEPEFNELWEKYRGCYGRIAKEDVERRMDYERKCELDKEISELKAEKRKHKKYIRENKKYVRKISYMLRSSTYELGMERFEKLWEIKDQLSEEICKHLENLKNYIHEALWHTKVDGVPRTNNLIESFYKATLPRKIKRVFVTLDGLVNRIILADLRWIENAIRT